MPNDIVSQRERGKFSARFAALVNFEHLAHGRQQRFLRIPAVGGILIAAPVPAVDIEVGIEKEGLPGSVVVEFEAGQIDAVHARHADALEARTEGLDLLVVMGNLPIPRPAIGSADAAKNDEQGLARAAGALRSPIETVVPAQKLVLSRNAASRCAEGDDCQKNESQGISDGWGLCQVQHVAGAFYSRSGFPA